MKGKAIRTVILSYMRERTEGPLTIEARATAKRGVMHSRQPLACSHSAARNVLRNTDPVTQYGVSVG